MIMLFLADISISARPSFKTRRSHLTLWRPAAFEDFCKKKRLNACGFVWKYICSCTGYGPG